MPRLPFPRCRAWIRAWLLCVVIISVALGAADASPEAWRACQDRVIATLEAAGLSDFGDVSAYTGATGTGALQAVIEQCGYHPERLSAPFCDDIYEQVYPACREDGFEGMSMAATSWVLIFDPDGALVENLRRVCEQSRPVSRATFGRRVCGE